MLTCSFEVLFQYYPGLVSEYWRGGAECRARLHIPGSSRDMDFSLDNSNTRHLHNVNIFVVGATREKIRHS